MLEVALLAALVLSQEDPAREPSPSGNVEEFAFANGHQVDVGSGVTKVTALSQFPTPNNGYFPIVIHIDNTRGPKQTLKLSFQSNGTGGAHTYSRSVDVEAHERRSVVLPVLANSRYGSLHVRGPGITKNTDANLYMNPVRAKQRLVLNLGTPDSFMESVGARPSYSPDAETQVVTLGLDEAPGDVTPYVGLDAVILTGGKLDQLSAGQRGALEAYAALGGHLVLMQGARGTAASFPLLENDSPLYGLGQLTFCDHCGYPEALKESSTVVMRSIEPKGRRRPYGYDDDTTPQLSLPVAQTPIGKFLVIIGLFTLAIGPGSLWIARKKGPSLLLVTIPGTAAITCLLIVGYSLMRDGFSVHATVQGVTLLDSRNHRAITASVGDAFYANLAPGGAQFPPQALVLAPASTREYQSVEQGTSMTFEEGTKVGSDFIPSRSYLEWSFLSVQPTRARGWW